MGGGVAVVDRELWWAFREFFFSCVTIDTESVFTSRLHELFFSFSSFPPIASAGF